MQVAEDTADVVDAPHGAQESGQPASSPGQNMDIVMQIPVSVDVRLGSTNMPVSRLMKLGRGSVVALDRKVGEPIDVVVNGRVIARGEVVLLEDGSSRFGISLTEIVNSGPSQKSSNDDGTQ
ncbi:MAG: flagellar motor switch protein FliN [Hyphomicrobiales bacterium]|nr:flagellar motor switch protein FliN [Hyphomicrobiales bacterium]